MKRNLVRLASEKFDVLVIGGGIQGATIVRKLARAGLSAALIEKSDFSAATSSNSLKILHGGLRYLQSLDFKRMRESIASRAEIMRIAPDLVRPLGCVMPLYKNDVLKNRYVFKVALYLNDLVGFDRNTGIDDSLQLPSGRVLSREKVAALLPALEQQGLSGGALWHDGIVVNTERLVLHLLLEADLYRACLANYVKANDFIKKGDRVYGVRAKDMLTGQDFEIKSEYVVNATGPWFQENLRKSRLHSDPKNQQWSLGLNIVIKKNLFGKYAVGLEGGVAGKNRLFFFVPWRGYTMIGTHYRPFTKHPDRFRVEKEDIEAFIQELNCVYPDAGIRFEDVTFFHGGMLPMSGENASGDVVLDKEAMVIDHERQDGLKGLLSIRSIKYTTSSSVAGDVAGIILNKIGNAALDPDLEFYGLEDAMLEDVLRKGLEFANPGFAVLGVKHFVENEMAATLSDIVFRRTELGTAECPSIECLHNIAGTMAEVMGWDMGRKEREIIEVLNRYEPLVLSHQ